MEGDAVVGEGLPPVGKVLLLKVKSAWDLRCGGLPLRKLNAGWVDVDGGLGCWCRDVEYGGDRDPEGFLCLGSVQQDSEGVHVGALRVTR